MLKETLKKEITQMIIRGEDAKTVSKRLANIMYKNPKNNDLKNCIRLVHTEHSYFMEQASQKAYEELEVNEYQFLATLDSKTSKICQDWDGEIVPLKDAVIGVNMPPMHPFAVPLLYHTLAKIMALDLQGIVVEKK